jgi:Transposase
VTEGTLINTNYPIQHRQTRFAGTCSAEPHKIEGVECGMRTESIVKERFSFIGIDYHKRYSVFCVLDPQGGLLERGRIDHLCSEQFIELVRRWPGCRVVFEACMNWHWLFEILEEALPREDIVLANAFKTRIIAEAQIKTDKVDARILADLLRANLISKVHICGKATREIKEVLRQRCFFVRQRTMVRNRIHRLLGAQHGLKLPQCTDLFGAKGMSFLDKLELPEPAGLLLSQQVALLRELALRIREDEKGLTAMMEASPALIVCAAFRAWVRSSRRWWSAKSIPSADLLPRKSSVDMPGCVPRRAAAEARPFRANCYLDATNGCVGPSLRRPGWPSDARLISGIFIAASAPWARRPTAPS